MTDTVLVGPYLFEVKRPSTLQMADDLGSINLHSCEIHVRQDLSVWAAQETLIHEVLHGIFHVCSFDEVDDDMEERLVKRISPVLTQVLRDNPELMRTA